MYELPDNQQGYIIVNSYLLRVPITMDVLIPTTGANDHGKWLPQRYDLINESHQRQEFSEG